ncbi:unnamed protein product [Cercopithifilaria johnstoni]|uniref:Uncharacterized protein n=1 Tax=Cercopithifilaria johnstoni TaxID=2874296 RepID=A0A8J2MIQ4_9BILA|nr:unnamed protein product [Cercopithifilaria johnstoni]
MQTPVAASDVLIPADNKGMKKATPTLDFQTVGSEMIGQEQKLEFQEWIKLMLDRECTPILYVYFAGIAILGVITAGIIVIIGLQCNWNFVALQ